MTPEQIAQLFTLITMLEIRMARIEDAITALRIDFAPAPPG